MATNRLPGLDVTVIDCDASDQGVPRVTCQYLEGKLLKKGGKSRGMGDIRVHYIYLPWQS